MGSLSSEESGVSLEGPGVRAGSFSLGSVLLGRGKDFEALAPKCCALGPGFWVFLSTELYLSVCLSGQLWGELLP